MVFWRKPKLPQALTPKLEDGERVVAWAPAGDEAVVATNRGLFLPGRTRLRWHEVHKATWSDGRLTVIPAVGVDAVGADFRIVADDIPVTIALATPSDVPN